MAAFLQFYQTSVSPLIRNGIPIIVVLGFWAALWRTGLTPKARIAGTATTAAMVIWWVTIDQLARFGFDASFWAVVRPLSFVFAISGVILMLRSQSIDGAVHAAPAVATAPGSWGGQRPSPSEFPRIAVSGRALGQDEIGAAIQTTCTSKVRRVDFGDCEPRNHEERWVGGRSGR